MRVQSANLMLKSKGVFCEVRVCPAIYWAVEHYARAKCPALQQRLFRTYFGGYLLNISVMILSTCFIFFSVLSATAPVAVPTQTSWCCWRSNK
jgi:hypothetical protein